MPGIGWECKCGKVIAQGQGFDWSFKCANLNCGKIHCHTCGGDNIGKDGACDTCSTSTRRIFSTDVHSKECGQKDEEAKKAKLREIVTKHAEVCNQARRCAKCFVVLNFGDECITIENRRRSGDYHLNCWMEIEKGGDDNDDSQRERERERAKFVRGAKNNQQLQHTILKDEKIELFVKDAIKNCNSVASVRKTEPLI